MRKIPVGTRVRVRECSGWHSNKRGTIIARRAIGYRGDGVPMLAGHYKPLDSSEELVQCADGTIFSMYGDRLEVVG